jgi:L-ribulose-5-phosphate 3-epimerase
VTYEEA